MISNLVKRDRLPLLDLTDGGLVAPIRLIERMSQRVRDLPEGSRARRTWDTVIRLRRSILTGENVDYDVRLAYLFRKRLR